MFGFKVTQDQDFILIQSAAPNTASFSYREKRVPAPCFWDGPVGLAHAKSTLLGMESYFASRDWICGEDDAYGARMDAVRDQIPNARAWEWWHQFGKPYPSA